MTSTPKKKKKFSELDTQHFWALVSFRGDEDKKKNGKFDFWYVLSGKVS